MAKIETPLEAMNAVREYLKDKKHWHKGAAFRDASGEPCSFDDHCSCCLDGAISKFTSFNKDSTHGLYRLVADGIENHLVESEKIESIVRFNDHDRTSHRDVMRVIDEYITILQKADEATE